MKPSIGSNCCWEDGSQIGKIRADCLLRGTGFDVTCFDPYRSGSRLLPLAPTCATDSYARAAMNPTSVGLVASDGGLLTTSDPVGS
jgi:hypothetical protein